MGEGRWPGTAPLFRSLSPVSVVMTASLNTTGVNADACMKVELTKTDQNKI